MLKRSLLFLLLGTASTAQAAVYWNAGVRSATPSVCFVGDALTSRPARVTQVLQYMRDYEKVANIKFNYLGTCPALVVQGNGKHYYGGDLRISLPNTSAPHFGQIPGPQCGMNRDANGNYDGGNDDWGSWSQSPQDLENYRGCMINLKLGDDADASSVPWRSHTLHEVGHALGFSHEHERSDVPPTCGAAGYGGGTTSGFITPYDRLSVMHYQFLACGIDGNYSQQGLSALDALAVHIMYPETSLEAEWIGTSIIPSNTNLQLTSAWAARGANMSFAATDTRWTINGTTQSTAANLNVSLAAGDYTVEWSHKDFLGRSYHHWTTARVLSPSDYKQKIVVPVSARLSLL